MSYLHRVCMDYFAFQIAMVTFDEHAYYPESIDGDDCFNTELAIATKDNKRALLKHLKNIDTSGKAKSIFSKGIQGVARYLNRTTADDSKCNLSSANDSNSLPKLKRQMWRKPNTALKRLKGVFYSAD